MDERDLLNVVKEIIGKERCLDDCAIYPCGDQIIVATTDMLHETTDFITDMTDWQIGWMSAAVTLSDIAAMGAEPGILLLAVGLDSPERLGEIIRGAEACCLSVGTCIAGGDIDHHQELTIVSSGFGVGRSDRIIRRSGSRIGDRVGVTGTLWRAQAALLGYHMYNHVLMEPKPRIREGQVLAQSGVTSMMDISDGLSLSLYDMCEANPCGYAVESDKIPLPAGISPEQALPMALYGGGDFELLFTIPKTGDLPRNIEYSLIGEVIADRVVLLDGNIMEKRGYEHHWE